eukprot:7324449-Pyramimonas_sp.AAC.1
MTPVAPDGHALTHAVGSGPDLPGFDHRQPRVTSFDAQHATIADHRPHVALPEDLRHLWPPVRLQVPRPLPVHMTSVRHLLHDEDQTVPDEALGPFSTRKNLRPDLWLVTIDI